MALVLMVGFYLLALAIASGLLYIPYAEMVYAHRVHPKLALGCVIGGAAILWSVLPRFDKFEAPGPQLISQQQQRLFAEIESVAKSVGQAMPAEVYAVPDINAWVAQRGGIMGFGSRRVMGLGLPLLRVLTRSQLRAVLAHEFGHYHGGDTKLGPWVYKTRGALGRTLAALAGTDGKGSLLQLPFLWYGKMFLRITHAVSRRQEFVADELAARAMGSKPLIDGLRTVHGVAPAFASYWSSECAPVLNAGFRPPLVEGFQAFVQSGRIAELIRKELDEELKSAKVDPYDTHPPLKERIAAVEHLPAGRVPAPDLAAITLLDEVTALETQLLAAMAGDEAAGKLKPIGWGEVCAKVYVPQWTSLVTINSKNLSGITPADLPALAKDLKALGTRFVHVTGEKIESENAEGMAGAVIGAALALLLTGKGGEPDATPGKPISIKLGSTEFEPFAIMQGLNSKEIVAESWCQKCVNVGVSVVDLGTVVTDRQPASQPAAAPAH